MGCELVRQMIVYMIWIIFTLVSIWLYDKQLGVIPFMFLSFYLFYKTFAEIKKQKKTT